MRIINGIRMYDSEELQELLGISHATLANIRKKGLLRSTRIGKKVYSSEQSLTDYLNGETKPEFSVAK